MIIGNKTFDTKHHGYIMGILNVTPDSFSDGGKYDHLDAALKHAEEMIKDGYKFYLSENNVWLCEDIPWKYVSL